MDFEFFPLRLNKIINIISLNNALISLYQIGNALQPRRIVRGFEFLGFGVHLLPRGEAILAYGHKLLREMINVRVVLERIDFFGLYFARLKSELLNLNHHTQSSSRKLPFY